MQHPIKRLLVALTSVVFGVVTALAVVAPASASPTPQGNLYSVNLGGHVASGVNRITQERQYWAPLPQLAGWTAECAVKHGYSSGNGPLCQSQVAIGGLLVQNTNGGLATGQAMVWNAAPVNQDPTTVCPADQYTLEGSAALTNIPGHLSVIDPHLLVPLDRFGSPQCFGPGDTEFGAIVISRTYHEFYFTNGSGEGTATLSNAPVHNVYVGLFATGEGMTVTSGANASFLPTGTIGAFTNQGLSETQCCGRADKRITWDALPQWSVSSTVDGNAPSVSNPLTITALGFGGSSSTSNVVP